MSDEMELTETDRAVLEFLTAREATYLAVLAQELAYPVAHIKDRCHLLADAGLLERESNTYYAITDAGARRIGGDSTADR